jgi:cytoskeletal protein CcmA (bactofilin family)
MFDKLKNTAPAERSLDTKPVEPPLAASSGFTQSAGKAAVIGAGIKITGEISGSENILIEGRVDGSINLGGNDVTIGKSGQVKADVSAKAIRVAGEVNGDLKAKERVVISGSGNVRGNVVAPRVVLEDGAIFKGSIDMDPGDSAASELGVSGSRLTGKTNGAASTAPAAGASTASASKPSVAADDASNNSPDLTLKGG